MDIKPTPLFFAQNVSSIKLQLKFLNSAPETEWCFIFIRKLWERIKSSTDPSEDRLYSWRFFCSFPLCFHAARWRFWIAPNIELLCLVCDYCKSVDGRILFSFPRYWAIFRRLAIRNSKKCTLAVISIEERYTSNILFHLWFVLIFVGFWTLCLGVFLIVAVLKKKNTT